MSQHSITLLRDAFPQRPAFDTALSAALLRRVAAGAEPEVLRLYRSAAIISFGPRDVRVAGFAAAAAAGRAAGFEAVERLAGGRAAAFHEQTLVFAWEMPDDTPREHIQERYVETAQIMAAALRRIRVDARVGEVPGEYCPGEYSVNAGGRTKLVGVGQRLVSRALHVGGFVVAAESARLRDVMVPVNRALDVPWDPATVGSVEDELGHGDYVDVERAVMEEFAAWFTILPGSVSAEALALAEELEARHLPAGAGLGAS